MIELIQMFQMESGDFGVNSQHAHWLAVEGPSHERESAMLLRLQTEELHVLELTRTALLVTHSRALLVILSAYYVLIDSLDSLFLK